ncbi:heparanase [Sarracenia purpurea var. burkii]
MGFCLPLFLFLAFLSTIWAKNVNDVVLVINGTEAVANTDANYICATIDWWPHDKCNYNRCPWGSSSIINLNLSHPLLAKTIQAFKPLRIRIGGSLQDKVLYDVGNLKSPCQTFSKMDNVLFGFSKGCLHMIRWDEVNHFFNKTGVILTFGLNALYGRHRLTNGVWEGDWDSSNAHDFIKYTISKGYPIHSWEFGNELSGRGIGARVGAEQYGRDLIKLKSTINELYKDFNPKPLLVAPGGFFNKEWYNKFLQVSSSHVVNAITHHIYNLGAGGDHNLVSKILDPNYLSMESETFISLKQTIQTHGPWASAWVGESGGASNSGSHNISNTFVNSFWYLDQLGMAAKYDTRVYCRQTLIGGNYGLLDTSTFVPNPDYYSALLWHQLMGKEVLAVTTASPYLRSYAHCSKGREGVTLLLINLSNQTDFNITIRNGMNIDLRPKGITKNNGPKSFVHGLKRLVSWAGSKASDRTSFREEYHLTPKDGDLHSKTVLLNGVPLQLTDRGDIPGLKPALASIKSPMSVNSLSIKFIVLPNFDAPGCK